MSERQKWWLDHGYTQEQINEHLKAERYKSKLSRERKKKNNEKNKDIILKIKNDLVGKTFEIGKSKITVVSISPAVDGKGFWVKVLKIFSDKSEGEFRSFCYFEDYSEEILEFI